MNLDFQIKIIKKKPHTITLPTLKIHIIDLASHAYKLNWITKVEPFAHRTPATSGFLLSYYRLIMTKHTIKLKDIDVLALPHCKIKDPERVETIINNIICGGPNELQIVTDFDFTLTKQKTEDGKPILSSFGMFNKCKSLPHSYRTESKKLYDEFRPIEICPNITQEEKKKRMIEWWTRSANLLK